MAGSGNDSDSELANKQAVMQGIIVFDTSPGAQASRELQNPRFLQACIYRCFCNYGLEDVSQQPPSSHFPTELREAKDGYQLQIDVFNDFIIPMDFKMGDPLRGNVSSRILPKKTQVDARVGRPRFSVNTSLMNLEPGNEVVCDGPLPNFDAGSIPGPDPYRPFHFPSPSDRANFSSNQELCAVVLSGGNK